MSIFRKLSIVAVAGMFLLALAVTASAQEAAKGPQWRGDFQTSFGYLSTSGSGNAAPTVTGSELFNGLESNLYWSGGTGELTTDARWRIRGISCTLWACQSAPATSTSGSTPTGTKARTGGNTNDPSLNSSQVQGWAFNALRLWVNWRPAENLRIQVGRLNSIAVPAFYSDIDKGQQPIRVQSALNLDENINGIDISYKMSALTVGANVGSNCAPSTACDGGLGGTLYNSMQIMPYVGFISGPLSVAARYNMSSGTEATCAAGVAQLPANSKNTNATGTGCPTGAAATGAETTNSVSSNMLYAGGSFDLGAAKLALDYQSWKRGQKVTGASDLNRSAVGLAVYTKVGLEAMINIDNAESLKNAIGTDKATDTIIQLQYLMKAGQGVWGPVFANESVDFKGGASSATGIADYKVAATTISVIFNTPY